MQCCRCQKELPDGALFCKYCGVRQASQQAGSDWAETPHSEPPQPTRQLEESMFNEKVDPQDVEAEEVEESPILRTWETLECPLEDTVPQSAVQTKENTLTRPDPEPVFQSIPEEELTAEEAAQAEHREDLVFNLDQILREIAPDAAVKPEYEDSILSAGDEETHRFDSNVMYQPPAAAVSAELDPESVTLESNHSDVFEGTDVSPDKAMVSDATVGEKWIEQEIAATDGPELVSSSGGARLVTRLEEEMTSGLNMVLPVPECEETVETVEEQIQPHVVQKGPQSVEILRPEKYEKSAEISAATEKRAKKSAVSVLWRLAVITAEVGIIMFLSFHLFLNPPT